MKQCVIDAGRARRLALLTCCLARHTHRLRAIGHLHEAEDESQEFPDLHAAIRAARKAYQTDGSVPDWQLLEALVSEAGQAD